MSSLLLNLGLAAIFICASGSMIMYNAAILKNYFPYPALLTTGHMLFSGILSHLLVNSEKLGLQFIKKSLPDDFLILPSNMDRSHFINSVLPIAALQAVSLLLSNLAYIYISVSLIQMIKASNTVWTYLWGMPLGLNAWNSCTALNLAVIGAGVAMSAMGSVDGSAFGMIVQLVGIIVEALRLALMQVLLQKRGFKLSPITALYYIAPAVVPMLLTIAFFKGEIQLLQEVGWKFPLWMMFSNMLLAFSLNFIGLVVIKRMSAVAYVLAGICKDILLVTGAGLIFGDYITQQQIIGYGIALVGLGYYNYPKSSTTGASAVSNNKKANDSDTEDTEANSSSSAPLIQPPQQTRRN